MPAGSFSGALLVSYVADRIGRKKTVILSGLVWVIGSTLQCAAVVCTLRSFSQAYHILSHHTGPRYANYWPRYLRCFCWDCIDHHSTLSGGNYFTLNPRSPRLCSTMVYYMGNSHPILYSVWLLLHRGYSVFPYSMGSPGNSRHHSFRWHAFLSRIPPMAS
jgi:MFS family permease